MKSASAPFLAVLFVFCSMASDAAENRDVFHAVRGRQPLPFLSGRLEAEQMEMQGSSRPQSMQAFGGAWSSNGQLLWDGKIDSAMTTSFEVGAQGVFDLSVQLTLAPDYGVFDLFINGERQKEKIDLYAPTVKLAESFTLSDVSLGAGRQTLALKLVGRNSSAKMIPGDRLLLGLDYLDLKRKDATSEVDVPTSLPTTTTAPLKKLVQIEPLSERTLASAFESHCLDCHQDEDAEAKVRLDLLKSRKDFLANIKTTQRIRNAIQRHEMPPKDESQPSSSLRQRWLASLDEIIDEHLNKHPSDAPVVMRRMNRYEYSNAVRDLLGLKGDIYPLPEKTIRADTAYFDPASGRFPHSVTVGNRTLGKNQVEQQMLTGVTPFAIDLQAEGGFNNRGDDLSFSPILLESFLQLGRSVVHAPEFNDYCTNVDELFRVPEETTNEQQLRIARDRLGKLMERAFRQPVDSKSLQRYHDYFSSQLDESKSFEKSMKNAVAALLASPKFIYLSESSATDTNEQLDPRELATRLSFFIWSTIPDEELVRVTRDGSLMKEEVFDSQVTRMLESPKSQALSQNFARQWLRLDQLITAVPDFERYETYYSRIGCEQWKLGLQSMLEPLLLFESIMVEDRSIMLLIDSDYAFRSRELQSWYDDEVPFAGKKNRDRFNTNQQQYVRTKMKDRREGGVITTAATLTMTSAPLRTSPIIRGAWVATAIFNQPPPPPPDDIPSIESDEKAIEAKGLTLRQRLVQHQENESCAACHSKIDPLGFALENYDAVGRWRDEYGSGLKIDASGKLFGEAEFTDVVGLKKALLENPDWFMRAFSEHMLSYALARELELSDEPAVENILAKVAADSGRFTTVVRSIVRSHPFRYRSSATGDAK